MSSSSKPPIIFSLRWWKIFFLILKEADLGKRLLCKCGYHKWDAQTVVNDGIVDDYNRCVRTPFCRYYYWMIVNREYPKETL